MAPLSAGIAPWRLRKRAIWVALAFAGFAVA